VVDLRETPTSNRHIGAEGTSEFRWRQCQQWPEIREISLDGHELAIVVAPHPDDESLALGGAISLMAAQGVAVIVVSVTDGEASHPCSTTVTPEELRVLRQSELRCALRELADGHPGNVANVQLHLRDGHVAQAQGELTEQLMKFFTCDDLCFATWEFDGHPDHEAVGRAAKEASDRTGARLLRYPVWTWHWAEPNDGSIPWERARKIVLNERDRDRKQRALECYRSQILPLGEGDGDGAVVTPRDLLYFQRPFEVVFE
jgi:LmbE family N-acetylglucosaminyl deacetylase